MNKRITLITACFAIMANSYAQVPTNGLVAYYPLDNNANDMTTFANHGVSTGITYDTDRFGKLLSAASFNGTSSFIEMPDASQIRPTNISVSIWIKPTNKTDQHIIGKNTYSNSMNEQYSFGFNYPSAGAAGLYGGVKMEGPTSCASPGAAFINAKSTQALVPNTWQLASMTYDGTDLKLYLNDKLIKTVTQASLIANCPGGTLRLGKWWQNFPDYYQGLMDEVRIYNRALTIQEVSQIYTDASPGLVAYYPLDGKANDVSAFSNDGISYTTTPAEGRCGGANTAMYFNGTSSYIEIPDAAQLRPKNMTINVWVNPTNKTLQHIVGKSTFSTSQNEQYSLGFNYPNDAATGLYGGFKKAGTNCSVAGGNFVEAKSNTVLTPGSWHMVTMTFDGSYVNLYLNNTLVKSEFISTPTTIADCIGGTLRLGKWWSSFPDYFQGIMDEVRIYNYPLKVEDIAALYNQCAIVTSLEGGVEKTNSSINVFPNPTENGLISVEDPTLGNAVLYVYNSKGMMIKEAKLNSGKCVIDLTSESKGIYYLKTEGSAKAIKIALR